MTHRFFYQYPNFNDGLAAALAVVFCFAIIGQPCSAQSFSQRFFMDMGASINVAPNEDIPASFSISAEPKLWLFNYAYLGLKLDAPIGSFGDNQKYELGLQDLEPKMGAASSLILSCYLEQHFCYSRLFFGYGLGRFFSKEIYGERTVSQSSQDVVSDYVRLNPAWGRQVTIGARGENFYLSMSFKKPFTKDISLKIPDYTSTTLGIEFGNGKHLTKFRRTNEYQLPPFMLEFGQQLAVPINKSTMAVGRAIYAEFRVVFKERFSIGARLFDLHRESYGADMDGYPLEPRPPFVDFNYRNFGRINTMRLVKSNTLFLDHYFPQKNGWLSLGLGGGWYRFEGLEDLDFGPSFKVPGIPARQSVGAVLRVGHKTGFFRAGIDLNLIGNGVPSYASLHVGIEPGFYIYHDKRGE